MGTGQLKEFKSLQKENERLRRAVSDRTLGKLILKEAARGSEGRPGDKPVECLSSRRAEP